VTYDDDMSLTFEILMPILHRGGIIGGEHIMGCMCGIYVAYDFVSEPFHYRWIFSTTRHSVKVVQGSTQTPVVVGRGQGVGHRLIARRE
jgi:hypothetical protein